MLVSSRTSANTEEFRRVRHATGRGHASKLPLLLLLIAVTCFSQLFRVSNSVIGLSAPDRLGRQRLLRPVRGPDADRPVVRPLRRAAHGVGGSLLAGATPLALVAAIVGWRNGFLGLAIVTLVALIAEGDNLS
ncbi:MAG TPA: hypothetical protein VK634_00090 [Reyranella sp.]|nr:hypothetical protein [Reyranella sp.]